MNCECLQIFFFRSIVSSLIIVLGCLAADNNNDEEELHPVIDQEHLTIVDVDKIDKIITKTGTSIRGLDLFHSPMSMTIITRQQLLSSGARTLSDALEIYVPGFQVMINKWVGTTWGLRGVASEINDKIIFLVNGVKQNLMSRDGGLTEISLGCLNDIERIEVLRGPSGLTYGSGAIAGVVNLVTRRHGKNSIEQTYSLGTWDRNFQETALLFDNVAFLNLKRNTGLGLTFGVNSSYGIGQEKGRLYGYPCSPYPQASVVSYHEDGWVPVTGSAGQTPPVYRTSFSLEHKSFRWYTRYTKQIQQASGWFVFDPLPGKEIMEQTDSFFIKGEMVSKSTDSLRWKFWSATEGYGNNRRLYQIDNVVSMVSNDFAIGEDSLQVTADFSAASEQVRLEQIPGYLADPPEAVIDQEFGEKRFGIGATYQLNRVRDVSLAIGTDTRYSTIGKDWHGINSFRGRKTVAVGNTDFLNFALFAEGYYDILGKDLARIHLGGRLDYIKRPSAISIDPNKTYTLGSGEAAFIITPNPRNAIKFVGHIAQNCGNADIYEPNFYFLDANNNLIQYDHFEMPDIRPDKSTPVIPQFRYITIEPEVSKSVELITSHRLADNTIGLETSVSLNSLDNLLLWSQELFRRVNTDQYTTLDISLEASFTPFSKRVRFGINHDYQRIVDMKYKNTLYCPYYNYDKNDTDWYTKENDIYKPQPKSTYLETLSLNGITNQISHDGKNFLNLAGNLTKLYLDVNLNDRMGFHLDSRIYWGLAGRRMSIERDTVHSVKDNSKRAHDYLDIDSEPVIKLNAALWYTFLENGANTYLLPFKRVTLSLYAYDILGFYWRDNQFFARNTIRWMQMTFEEERDLFGVDLISIALRLQLDL